MTDKTSTNVAFGNFRISAVTMRFVDRMQISMVYAKIHLEETTTRVNHSSIEWVEWMLLQEEFMVLQKSGGSLYHQDE